MNILIYKNEQQYGPYTSEQVWEYVQQGHFTLEDHACSDGQNWVLLSQIPGFAVQTEVGQSHQAKQPAQAQVARAGAQVPQAKVTGVDGGGSKKKKIILFSSISAVCLAGIITGLVIWQSGGGDEEGDDEKPDRHDRRSTREQPIEAVDQIGGSAPTDDEEGGGHAGVTENVENARRDLSIGSVVERERDLSSTNAHTAMNHGTEQAASWCRDTSQDHETEHGERNEKQDRDENRSGEHAAGSAWSGQTRFLGFRVNEQKDG